LEEDEESSEDSVDEEEYRAMLDQIPEDRSDFYKKHGGTKRGVKASSSTATAPSVGGAPGDIPHFEEEGGGEAALYDTGAAWCEEVD